MSEFEYSVQAADALVARWEAAVGDLGDEAGEYLMGLIRLARTTSGFGLREQESLLMRWAEEHVAAAEAQAEGGCGS